MEIILLGILGYFGMRLLADDDSSSSQNTNSNNEQNSSEPLEQRSIKDRIPKAYD